MTSHRSVTRYGRPFMWLEWPRKRQGHSLESCVDANAGLSLMRDDFFLLLYEYL
jgi:hypothetical protein